MNKTQLLQLVNETPEFISMDDESVDGNLINRLIKRRLRKEIKKLNDETILTNYEVEKLIYLVGSQVLKVV